MSECWYHKFDPPQCTAPAVWIGKGTESWSDQMTWCDEHKPSDNLQYYERIKEEEKDRSHDDRR